mgnify:CR=1 FL=1
MLLIKVIKLRWSFATLIHIPLKALPQPAQVAVGLSRRWLYVEPIFWIKSISNATTAYLWVLHRVWRRQADRTAAARAAITPTLIGTRVLVPTTSFACSGHLQ